MRPTSQRLYSQTYRYKLESKTLREIRDDLKNKSHSNRHLELIVKDRLALSKNYSDGKYRIDFSFDRSHGSPNLRVTFAIPHTSNKSIGNAIELFNSGIRNEHIKLLSKPTLCGFTIESDFSELIHPKTLLLKSLTDYHPEIYGSFHTQSALLHDHSYTAHIEKGLKKHDAKTIIRSKISLGSKATSDFHKDSFETFNDFSFYLCDLGQLRWKRAHALRSYQRGVFNTASNSEKTKQLLSSAIEISRHLDTRINSRSNWNKIFKAENKLRTRLANIT